MAQQQVLAVRAAQLAVPVAAVRVAVVPVVLAAVALVVRAAQLLAAVRAAQRLRLKTMNVICAYADMKKTLIRKRAP